VAPQEIRRKRVVQVKTRHRKDTLCLAEGTVKNHITNIRAKLAVRDRTQAALKAIEIGIL
jgi:DNA-binding CsgD family transcriptional regulator